MAGEPHLPGLLLGGGMVRSWPVSFPHLRKLQVFLTAALTHPSSPGGGGSLVVRGQGWGLEPEAEFTFRPWAGGLTSLPLFLLCEWD